MRVTQPNSGNLEFGYIRGRVLRNLANSQTLQISPLPTSLPEKRNLRNSHPKNGIDATALDYAATAANLDTGMTNAPSNPNKETMGPAPIHHALEPPK